MHKLSEAQTCTNLLTSEVKSILFDYFETHQHYVWAKHLAPLGFI